MEPCPAKGLCPYTGVSGPKDDEDTVEFLRASELCDEGGVSNAEETPEYGDIWMTSPVRSRWKLEAVVLHMAMSAAAMSTYTGQYAY